MLTVGKDAAGVERLLSDGRSVVRGGGGRRGGWGHARLRVMRGAGEVRWRLRPRRARGSGCRRTHVLLPVGVLARRADAVAVIGAALAAKAAGLGARPIAAWLDRPLRTVRGWLTRFGSRIEAVRGWFTRLLSEVAVDPVSPLPAGSVWADALAAITAAAAAVRARFAVTSVTVGRVACAAS